MSGMSDEPYEQQIILARRKLKAPRAAAISGILFAALYGSGMTLLALSIPPFAIADNTWVETSGNTVSLALLLVPVLRDRLPLVHRGDPGPSGRCRGPSLLLGLPGKRPSLHGPHVPRCSLRRRASQQLCPHAERPYRKRRLPLRTVGGIRGARPLRDPHGWRIHDLIGDDMAPYRSIGPRLDDPDLRAGAGASAEHQFVPVGDPDLSGMGPDNQRSPAYSEPPRSA